MVHQFDRSRGQRFIALFAAILLTSLAFVQTIHLHEELSRSGASRSHCALCIFSHSPAVVTAARSAPAPVSAFATRIAAEAQLRSRLLVPSTFIRPPPAL